MVLTTIALIAAFRVLPVVAPQPAAACLHDPATETQEQHARRLQALGLARTINSAEAVFSAKVGVNSYGDIGQLVAYNFIKPASASGQYVAGFELRLDVMDKAYWFEVVDKTDPCGFRFISNQSGLIFTAEPIR